jgi:hypothetical protein
MNSESLIFDFKQSFNHLESYLKDAEGKDALRILHKYLLLLDHGRCSSRSYSLNLITWF